MATIKANPNYRPDIRDINMFLRDLKKSGFLDDGGCMRLLKQEYPTLTNEQVAHYVDMYNKKNEPRKTN